VGWVEDANGEPVADAEVYLAPQHVNRQAARVAGQASQTRKVVSNERGFFQFPQIASGNFTISARTSARAGAAPREVSIRDSSEHRLPEPLVLEPPAAMLVQIDPPLSPDRQPWNVRLSRLLIADSTHVPTASGRASDAGTWSAEGVERGPYHVEILDPSGSTVARLDADVDRETTIVHFEIGKVRVEGRVRFGSEPIASELKFSSAHGSVRMMSGNDGVFRAWLPKDGSWNVQITPKDALQRVRTRVDVRVPADDTHATVNIDLPAGRLEGVVVDEDGKPVPETEVLVLNGSDILANAGTDDEGRFVIAGLEAGAVILQAKKGALASEYHRCTVTVAAASKETLVLRAPAEWKGRLIHSSGAAVVGALIRYFDEDELLTTVSGPTGEFSLRLASGARFADIVVIAPRLPVVVDRVQMGRDEKVVVPDLAAVIRVAPRATGGLPRIGRAGTRILPISMLFAPRQGFGPPPEASNGAFELHLAPGHYNVCYSPAGDCVPVAAEAGAIARVSPPKAEGGP
ncbi:MAG TPA: carboxypeptidase-like regulatory domain-containing protein, partial [Thermoanaerobaculia bacterium]|nr:carboxypeptidase-like regulatory domain-containing protein [Thermoanaerobaculia bacterium]